jgi:hypothetical protein
VNNEKFASATKKVQSSKFFFKKKVWLCEHSSKKKCNFAPMNELNLPAYDVKMRGTREKPEIFDFLRKRYVTLTPEEWVRQHFTHWLVEHKGYPKGLLGNEIALKCGEKTLRCDSILYNKEALPQMIIEYKAPTVSLTQRVFNQISAYNLLLHVDYLVVSNGLQHYCCKMDYQRQTYEFLQEIPDYASLISL